ncbi:hypothetical protein [Peribacillus frigoritolerans]|uniref:hypothetical protein n=1 Tax=Peribacillus frigoritolerans TaxID=450367 RepID=UPI0020C022CA|nr:hypothetical protein [Peribacillus frigoritolerans]
MKPIIKMGIWIDSIFPVLHTIVLIEVTEYLVNWEGEAMKLADVLAEKGFQVAQVLIFEDNWGYDM